MTYRRPLAPHAHRPTNPDLPSFRDLVGGVLLFLMGLGYVVGLGVLGGGAK